jgi:hypothetical protein
MAEDLIDYGKTRVKAKAFVGTVSGQTAAAVTVAAGTDGLSAGTVQEALQALATRVKAIEDGA